MIFGWKPETAAPPPERRIEKLALSKVALPTEYSLLSNVDEVTPFDQGNTGSCPAEAFAGAARIIAAVDMPPDTPNIRLDDMPTPSRRWLYELARLTHAEGHLDEGTYLSAIEYVARELGWPEERTAMPWDQYMADSDGPEHDAWINAKPTRDDRRHAHDQRGAIEGYAITTYGDDFEGDLRAALAVEHAPVICGGVVTWDFLRLTSWDPFTFGSDDAGGHAMCIVGYDDESYHFLNSWGGAWGFGGLCRIRRASVKAVMRDFYAITKNKGATS